MESVESVQNCTTCGKLLEGGYASIHIGKVMTQKICFGCDKKLSLQEYKETRRLRTRFLLNVNMDLYRQVADMLDYQMPAKEMIPKMEDYLASVRAQGQEDLVLKAEAYLSSLKIQDKTKEFEEKVWFSGLQTIIRASKFSGVSARPKNKDKFMVLTMCSAGRILITIEDKNNSITLITAEDSDQSRMGWQGVDATEEAALALIDRAITMYQAGELKFKTDKKVGFGF